MTLAPHVEKFLAAQYAHGTPELSIRAHRSHLGHFLRFIEREGAAGATEIDREVIESYMDELAWVPTRTGQPMKAETRNGQLWSIKALFQWLVATDVLAANPTEKVAYCRKADALPKSIVSLDEMKKLLLAPDVQTHLGFRDRVVLELLYSSGLRLRELCNLDVLDVDPAGGFVRVRHGKGDRERVTPMGKVVAELIESYLAEVRPKLLAARNDKFADQALILSQYGERLGPRGVAKLVARYVTKANLKTHLTPHGFRHACATHMLRGGANLRHLQEMLGHRRVTSTEIYTRVTITELQEAHAKFHPRGSIDEVTARPLGLRGRR